MDKRTIVVEDFMGEEEEETSYEDRKQQPKKDFDLNKIVSQFILK